MKKTILVLTLLLSMTMSMQAQTDEFKQTTKELIELGSSSYSPKTMKKNMSDLFKGIFSTIAQQSGQTSELDQASTVMDQLIDQAFGTYFEDGEFTNDMVDIMAPALEKEFTLDELKQLKAIYTTPEAKAFMAKGSGAMGDLSAVTQDLMQPIMTIAMGGDAPQVEKVKCSDEYRQVYDQYFQLTTGAATAKLKERMGTDNSNPTVKKVKDYLTEAIPEMTLKLMINNYSIDDLKYGIQLTSNPLVQRYITACSNIDDNATKPIQEKIHKRFTGFLQNMGLHQ